jgi:hypothetical protein
MNTLREWLVGVAFSYGIVPLAVALVLGGVLIGCVACVLGGER